MKAISKSIFKCKISYSGTIQVDDIIFVAANNINTAIKAAKEKAIESNPDARVIDATELISQFIET